MTTAIFAFTHNEGAPYGWCDICGVPFTEDEFYDRHWEGDDCECHADCCPTCNNEKGTTNECLSN